MSAHPPFLVSPLLDRAGLAHGFFSRDGGVSAPPYQSLNTGPGSGDLPENVAENRRRCMTALGVAPDRLVTAYQVHSPDVKIVTAPWANGPEQVDGLVTDRPGLALGVLTADCMPFLFADAEAGVIGAAHAGWRGALAGVLENTVAAMTKLGAKPERIRAAVGPCLRQPDFEVGLDLVGAFLEKHPRSEQFFELRDNPEKRFFDLVGFGRMRLADVGVSELDDLGLCTLAHANRFFSYRAMKRRGEPDYGRNLSAIALV
ncbi:MAG: peptidoglycan editing factor PgeF [Parvularculaceae bacterium]